MLKFYRFKKPALFILMITVFAAPDLQAVQVLFTPQLTISEEYSDNIDLGADNEKDDFITTVALAFSSQILGRTAGLELNLNPSYSAFAKNTEFEYWRYAANLRVWNDFSRRTHLEVTTTYLETEEPRDDSAQYLRDPFAEPAIGRDIHRQGRERYRRNVNEARLTHQIGVDDAFFAAVQYSILESVDPDNTSDTVDPAEGDRIDDLSVWQPSIGLDYRFDPQWAMQTQLLYSNRDYVDAVDREEYNGNLRLLRNFNRTLSGFVDYRHTHLDFAEETENDYQVYAPSVGVKYQFQQEASITVGVGYYFQQIENVDDDEQGFFLNSEIFKTWSSPSYYVTLVGGSGYDIDDTGSEDLGLNIYHQGRFIFGYNLTQKSTGTVYAGYRYDEYPNKTPDRTDHLISAGAGLHWQALQWMNVGLSYDFTYRISDAETEEYSQNRVLLVITIAPTTPYRWY